MTTTSLPSAAALACILLIHHLSKSTSHAFAFQFPVARPIPNNRSSLDSSIDTPRRRHRNHRRKSSHESNVGNGRYVHRRAEVVSLRRRRSILRLDMGATASSVVDSVDGTRRGPGPSPSPSSVVAFRDRSILITGASRGLGRSLAISLSRCRPRLLILSGRDECALLDVREACERNMVVGEERYDGDGRKRRRVEIVICDLSDADDVARLADASLRLANGVVDVLINNGGISSRSSFLDTTLDVDLRLMRVNFFSGAALAKGMVPAMAEKGGGGRVIWISSVQGKLGTPYRTSYAASKFAVQGYCESLRSELASSGIAVHVVSPGYVRTELSLSAIMGDGRSYSKMDETTANGADPDEVAVSILDSVAAGKSDIVVAANFSARVAMWLKFLAPSILDRILAKRFEKQRIALKKNE